MKNTFENSNEKLEKIIYEKLDAINASKEEREKAEYELSIIKLKDDAKIFLFFYELASYMKKENIYFMSRGVNYTSLYCSYLLGLLEYNPIKYNLSTEAYEDKSSWFCMEIQQSKKAKVFKYIRESVGRDRLYKTTYFNERRNTIDIKACTYLLSSKKDFDLEKVKINGRNAVRTDENEVYNSKDYFTFSLFHMYTLDELQKVDADIDYGNFEEKAVYEYMTKVQLTPQFMDKEKIKDRKPTNLKELAYCVHDVVNVNERNICHHINYAILYYKLAKLRMLGLIDESYELKEIGINDNKK